MLEKTVIDYISKYLSIDRKKFPHVISEIGIDDSAILDIGNGKYLVISMDAISSRPLAYTLGLIGPRELGHYVVYANISDIASDCAKPLGIMLFIGLPKDYPEENLKEIILGIKESCFEYNTCILGGDTKYASKLQLLGNVIGIAEKDEITTRYGAKKGDVIAVTGHIGTFTAAGYAFIKQIHLPAEIKDIFIKTLKYPKAALKESRIIAKYKAGHGGIDISDGLAVDLHKLCRESKVGALIYEEKIPIHPAVRRFSEIVKVNPLNFAFGIGGDWEIIFTIDPDKWDKVKREFKNVGLDIFEIGEITDDQRLSIITSDGNEEQLPCRGHLDDLQYDTFEEEVIKLVEEGYK